MKRLKGARSGDEAISMRWQLPTGRGLSVRFLSGCHMQKGLHTALKKPLIPVHHIEGHVFARLYISNPKIWKPPFLCLVVSGGHSHIAVVEDYGKYRLIG